MGTGEDYTNMPTLWVNQHGMIHRNEMGELFQFVDESVYDETV